MATDNKSKVKTKSIFSVAARFNENKDLATRLLNPSKEILSKCKDHNSYPCGKTSFFEEDKNLFLIEEEPWKEFRANLRQFRQFRRCFIKTQYL